MATCEQFGTLWLSLVHVAELGMGNVGMRYSDCRAFAMEDAEVDTMRVLTADARSANITLGVFNMSLLFLSFVGISSFPSLFPSFSPISPLFVSLSPI